MNKKIVFFDIDGTLLDEETHTIPNSCKEALKQAKKNGHLLFINTGRPISTIEDIITDLDFDGYICGCGTYIKYKDEVILHATLDQTIRQEIIHQVFKYNVEAILEGEEGAYFSSNITSPFLFEIKERYQQQNLKVYDFNSSSLIEFDKMTLIYHEKSDIESFKNYLKQYFEIIQRGEDFIEVIPLGHSKATGIQYILDYLDLDIDDCITIGDSTNDLSMLTYTKNSIAMGNSHPSLFNQVAYVTTNINDDGIYNALKHYELI
jgi:hypothetical protein